MSSVGESYLTLHVTYHQEMAIKNLYTSKGWLFKKKVLKVIFVDPDTEEVENEIVRDKVTDVSVNEIPNTGQDTEIERHATKEIVSSSNKIDNARVVIEKLKVETRTDEQDREGNDERMFDDDTEDNADDWVPNLNDNSEDDNDDEDDDEEYTPVKGTKGRKRKSGGLKLTIKKGTSGKKARRSRTSETFTQSTPEKSIPSTSTAETERDETVEDDGINVQNIVKTEGHEAPTEDGNVDLGVDTDRTALEIELQETDDIDHYETVHKTLSPDEPFSPPSDVQESDGFSPSLGCYYCHDCGYTFQLQRWYNIHKWDGRCVYTCQVCSMKFTFRNITAYRDHLKTHNFQRVHKEKQDMDTNTDITGELGSEDFTTEKNQRAPRKKIHFCAECDSSFSTLSSLWRHKKIHKGETLKCNECPEKIFRTAYDLHDHERNAHGDGLICAHCSKRFNSRSGLRYHLKSITGEYDFHCEICDRRFNSKTHYEAHCNAHRGYKPYKCEHCQKSFGLKSSLNRHISQCFKDKTVYKCDICNTKYSSKSTFDAHVGGMHSNTKQRCNICGKTFKWAASYYRHMQKHKN